MLVPVARRSPPFPSPFLLLSPLVFLCLWGKRGDELGRFPISSYVATVRTGTLRVTESSASPPTAILAAAAAAAMLAAVVATASAFGGGGGGGREEMEKAREGGRGRCPMFAALRCANIWRPPALVPASKTRLPLLSRPCAHLPVYTCCAHPGYDRPHPTFALAVGVSRP